MHTILLTNFHHQQKKNHPLGTRRQAIHPITKNAAREHATHPNVSDVSPHHLSGTSRQLVWTLAPACLNPHVSLSGPSRQFATAPALGVMCSQLDDLFPGRSHRRVDRTRNRN